MKLIASVVKPSLATNSMSRAIKQKNLDYFKSDILPKLEGEYTVVEFNLNSFRISRRTNVLFVDFFPKSQKLFVNETKEWIGLTADGLLQNIEIYLGPKI